MGGPPFSLLLAVGQSSIMWPFGGDNQFVGHGGREREEEGGVLGSYESTRVASYSFLPLSFEPGFFFFLPSLFCLPQPLVCRRDLTRTEPSLAHGFQGWGRSSSGSCYAGTAGSADWLGTKLDGHARWQDHGPQRSTSLTWNQVGSTVEMGCQWRRWTEARLWAAGGAGAELAGSRGGGHEHRVFVVILVQGRGRTKA
ncbi:hypothetical protein LZ31DRAFT_338699 [Colletotrichum somersetense]|nr:hypothetical protein LZ31DRAFT_338699 [Colletotrichum somersetense]